MRSGSTATGLLPAVMRRWVLKISDLLRIRRVRCRLRSGTLRRMHRRCVGFPTVRPERECFYLALSPQRGELFAIKSHLHSSGVSQMDDHTFTRADGSLISWRQETLRYLLAVSRNRDPGFFGRAQLDSEAGALRHGRN